MSLRRSDDASATERNRSSGQDCAAKRREPVIPPLRMVRGARVEGPVSCSRSVRSASRSAAGPTPSRSDAALAAIPGSEDRRSPPAWGLPRLPCPSVTGRYGARSSRSSAEWAEDSDSSFRAETPSIIAWCTLV